MKTIVLSLTSIFILSTASAFHLAPEATIRRLSGSKTQFSTVLAGKPSVVIFYRGGWCAYCNLHLEKLRKIESSLLKKGVRLVAISADSPEEIRRTRAEKKMAFELYSDQEMALAKAFGISFRVEKPMFEKLTSVGVDIEKASGRSHRLLPIPSVFLISKSGKILFKHSNPDFKVRLDTKRILKLVDQHFR